MSTLPLGLPLDIEAFRPQIEGEAPEASSGCCRELTTGFAIGDEIEKVVNFLPFLEEVEMPLEIVAALIQSVSLIVDRLGKLLASPAGALQE